MELQFQYALSTIISSAAALGLGIFVLFKNPKAKANQLWFAFNLTIAGWAIPQSLYVAIVRDASLADFLVRLCYACGVIWIPTVFLHYVLVYLNRARRAPIYFAYGFSILHLFLVPSHWFLAPAQPKFSLNFYTEPGPLYHSFFLCWSALIVYAMRSIYLAMKQSEGSQKNQLRYLFYAMLIGYAGGTSNCLLIYNIEWFPYTPYGTYGIPIYIAIFTYAMVKHHLMDIDIVIRKSLVYSVLVATITAVYFCVVLLAEKWFQGMLGYRSLLISVVVGFAIALGFTPLKEVVQRVVDQFFFRGGVGALAQENERLRHEVTCAERLKAVGTLAAGMAHEIKNPMTAIKTFTEFLPDRYDDVEFRQKFQRIVGGEVNRINHLVQRLLEFARPSLPQLAPVQVSEVIRETLECLQAIAVQKRIRVETSFDEPDHIQADRGQLKQALLNILLNGIEAMESGGRLDVTTRRHDGFVEVRIEDTGSGIPQDVLPRVFDPFYTTKERGTGLGLSIVHTIVTEHGGRIALESEPGRGTRVTLKFPVTSSADTEALAQSTNTATNGTD